MSKVHCSNRPPGFNGVLSSIGEYSASTSIPESASSEKLRKLSPVLLSGDLFISAVFFLKRGKGEKKKRK